MSDTTGKVNGNSKKRTAKSGKNATAENNDSNTQTVIAPPPAPPRLRPGQVYSVIARLYQPGPLSRHILADMDALELPPSSGLLRVWEEKAALIVLRLHDDGICESFDIVQLATEIQRYTHKYLSHKPAYDFEPKEANACSIKVRALLPVIPRPIDVLFRNQQPGDLCFSRIQSDLAEGVCPDWDNAIARMTNSEAFMCWLANVFTDGANREKAMVLYGDGGDGKGSIASVLLDALGAAGKPFQTAPWEDKSRFWATKFIGVRLAIFTDYQGSVPLNNAIFKCITGGGDKADVEPKFRDAYSADLTNHCLFLTNNHLQIDTSPAMQRRFLYCILTKGGESEGQVYRDRLKLQFGAFVWKCIQLRNEKYPDNRKPIVGDLQSRETLIELGKEGESMERHAFEEFWVEMTSEEKPAMYSKVGPGTLSSEVTTSLQEYFRGNQAAVKKVRLWIAQRFGTPTTVRITRVMGCGTVKQMRGDGWKTFRPRTEEDKYKPLDPDETPIPF